MNYELNDVIAENQMSMFTNVLTINQQNEVDEYVKINNRIENEKYSNLEEINAMLNRYELSEFVKADYELIEETYIKQFNWYNEKNKFECEITTYKCKGGLKFEYHTFDSREQTICKAHNHIWISDVDLRDEKMTISNIANNYRSYKISSIRKKIEEKNNEALSQNAYSKSVVEASNIVRAEFEELYPKATVTEYFADIKEYNVWRNRRCIKVVFESGSYVEYQVFTNANKSVIKVVDKQKESIEQIMNRFNLQEKIS
jgi:hypothetical protein